MALEGFRDELKMMMKINVPFWGTVLLLGHTSIVFTSKTKNNE